MKEPIQKEEKLYSNILKAFIHSQVIKRKPSRRRRIKNLVFKNYFISEWYIIIFLEYIPEKIPSNFKIAREHFKATRVGIEKKKISKKDKELKICVCCGRKIERSQFSLKCKPLDLAYLGSGYPLYFYYLKFCALILIVLLLSSGGYNLVTNFFFGGFCT